ncbi:MAG: 1-acyl-sn-glycerol-3-phosphate acyltransferase [Verrucomicrobia bacterium]|nr:1-acyl-sn-glycerol-3-phosphate acyltransferase [Verrucomicrobiota bacterium]
MQPVVFAKPYKFIPPRRGVFWPSLLRPFQPRLLRSHGVVKVEYRGLERLRASVAAGHGMMLAPNHCRPCDPFVVAGLGYQVGRPVHIMASAHLFMQGRLQRFLLRRAGAFSIYREGMDREALKCAIQITAEAKRPLVLFPEGVISRHNDRLNPLMEGTAMIARSAAKQRAAAGGGRVVVHPVAVRYVFDGDVEATVGPMMADIEHRLTWKTQSGLPLVERIAKIGVALLALKETEFLGAPQTGDLSGRIQRLIDHLLCPIEEQWIKGRRETGVVARVKALRSALVPDLVAGSLAETETAKRWDLLSRLYLAQQLAFYPAGYFRPEPTPERILETVERFEEDMTDKVRTVSPIRALVDVGEAIEVSPERVRGAEGDPLMLGIQTSLEAMLASSLVERHRGAVLQ